MAIHLGRPSPDASRDLPGRRRGNPPADLSPLAASTRSCSRWGLPCRRRRRRRGAPLPHPFTLARCAFRETGAGGLLSVALSLGSPPPGVTRHRVPVEPGLSSLRQVSRVRRAAIRPSDDREMTRASAPVKSFRSWRRGEPRRLPGDAVSRGTSLQRASGRQARASAGSALLLDDQPARQPGRVGQLVVQP